MSFQSLIVFLFLCASSVFAGEKHVISIEDVVKRVSSSNYLVQENALKVYQAQMNIQKVREDLLPRLNLWSVAGLVLDPLSVVERIPEVAPFLVPGNWFRLQEVKILYLAEKEGYRALWSNEVYLAKTLYKNVLFDVQLLKHIRQSITDLEKIHRIVKTREIFGGAEPGAAREIEIQILGLKQDEQDLQVLLDHEHAELTFSLGFKAEDTVVLSDVSPPDVGSLKPLDPKEHEFRALAMSPERRQFDHFLSILNQIKKELQYSFLGVSEISRGSAGGIFDAIPISNGIELGASFKIVEGQKEILLRQKEGVEETLKRQLFNLSQQYNLDLGNYGNFKRRYILARDSKLALLRRVQLGENVNGLQLSEASRNQIQAETALYAVQFRVLNSTDRVNRIIFDGDYSLPSPLIESLTGGELK